VTVYKGQVLTLRCGDFSETSQVVTLLGPDAGLVRCLAKGSKRGRNPFGGPLDRWTLGHAVFSLPDPNRLGTLMELYELERFEGLRAKLPAFLGASAATELVLALVPEVEPQPEAFALAVETLRHLAEAEPAAARAVAFAFAWRLLAALGYGPDLGHCAECGAVVEDSGEAAGPRPFSGALGGLVCPRCRAPDRTVRLTAQGVRAIRFLASRPWDEVRRVRLADSTAKALRQALLSRAEELAGQRLSAVEYV
jgi:DNA repair protein RecO